MTSIPSPDWRSSAQIRVAPVGLPATRQSGWSRSSAVGHCLGLVRRATMGPCSFCGEHTNSSDPRGRSKHVLLTYPPGIVCSFSFPATEGAWGRRGLMRYAPRVPAWGPTAKKQAPRVPHRCRSYSVLTRTLIRSIKRPTAVARASRTRLQSSVLCLPWVSYLSIQPVFRAISPGAYVCAYSHHKELVSPLDPYASHTRQNQW